MTGAEICNLVDSLTERGLDDTEIIKITFETEGRQRQERELSEKMGSGRAE